MTRAKLQPLRVFHFNLRRRAQIGSYDDHIHQRQPTAHVASQSHTDSSHYNVTLTPPNMSSTSQSTKSVKPSPTANTKPSRLPAPSLFVGPPSRNTSQLSVSRQLIPDAANPKNTRDPVNRQRSALSRPWEPPETPAEEPKHEKDGSPRLRKDSERSTEARWKEMQSTLNEVELTAQSSTHVFGESHAKALDDLRNAQVALAWAWGRGNEESGLLNASATDNDISHFSMDGGRRQSATAGEQGEFGRTRNRADTGTSASTVLSDESVRSDETAKESRAQMEDETAEDIRRASERRGKNEEYFRMVERSVGDVVSKLDIVAEAMRGVEAESRSLWSGSSATGSSSDQGEQGHAVK